MYTRSQCLAGPGDLLCDGLTGYWRSGPGGRRGNPFQSSACLSKGLPAAPSLRACPLEAKEEVSSQKNKLKGPPAGVFPRHTSESRSRQQVAGSTAGNQAGDGVSQVWEEGQGAGESRCLSTLCPPDWGGLKAPSGGVRARGADGNCLPVSQQPHQSFRGLWGQEGPCFWEHLAGWALCLGPGSRAGKALGSKQGYGLVALGT